MKRIFVFENRMAIDLGEIIAVHPAEHEIGILPMMGGNSPHRFYFKIELRGGETATLHTGFSTWRETVTELPNFFRNRRIRRFHWNDAEIASENRKCEAAQQDLVRAWKEFHGQAD